MIDTSDLDNFAAKLNASPNKTVELLWKDEWSERVAQEMRGRAPVDSGKLRDSITAADGSVVVGVDYGVYVEYGTSDTAPQPFAGPSIDRVIRPSAEDAGRRVILELT